jgi:2-iminobutanoate/2-iminopropanoate deaminase
VRLDAIASTSADRGAIIVPDVPLPPGVRVHGVFAGGVAYLSGVSAPDMQGGNQGETLYRQVGAVLDRMDLLLRSQKLGLGDLGRTWMFQRNLDVEVRAFYGKARQERYEGLFELNKFPANSGIQMPNLGDNTMIRSIGFAASNKTYVVSDKVRLSPGSFSQAVQFGDWLHICGIDAYDLKRNLESPGDLAGQTERCMEYTRFIVEAAGGKMSDIVKTTAYIINGEDREKFARPFQTYFDKHGASRIPSSAVMDVQQLSSGILVEIDSVAYLGHRDPRSNG